VGAQAASAAAAEIAQVPFTATATVAPPSRVDVLDGNGQQGIVGRALQLPLLVRVLDRFGNPVPSTLVTFAVTAGGGSANPNTRITDAQGTASTVWTLGATAGVNVAEARVPDVTPATFTSTGYPVFSITALGPQPVQGAFEQWQDGIVRYTCDYSYTVSATGGVPGTTATWIGLTSTWTLKSTGTVQTDEDSGFPDWGSNAVATGDSRTFSRSAGWSSSFTLRHTFRYRMTDGEERSTSFVLDCR
jgi:hypothetical protein